MTKATLKTQIRTAVGKVDDEKMLAAIYSFIKNHLDAEQTELTMEEKRILDERIARHKAGLDKEYSWDEVKAMVRNKKSRK